MTTTMSSASCAMHRSRTSSVHTETSHCSAIRTETRTARHGLNRSSLRMRFSQMSQSGKCTMRPRNHHHNPRALVAHPHRPRRVPRPSGKDLPFPPPMQRRNFHRSSTRITARRLAEGLGGSRRHVPPLHNRSGPTNRTAVRLTDRRLYIPRKRHSETVRQLTAARKKTMIIHLHPTHAPQAQGILLLPLLHDHPRQQTTLPSLLHYNAVHLLPGTASPKKKKQSFSQ